MDSSVTLLSSIHGRDRRLLRNISKVDLQAAVKFGVKVRGCHRFGQPTWKYTFAHVVYITDETSRYEITSYVLPIDIPLVPLTSVDEILHAAFHQLLLKHPEKCTTHTVMVVDQSGSMRTSDVVNFKTRSEAVYGTIALDVLGQKLDQNLAKVTDAVSLIEMNEDATLIFEREPITNLLFNKFASRRLTAQPRGHGNYIPALERAEELLEKDEVGCALLLVFLSDGKPSDRGPSPRTRILDQMLAMAERFGPRLTVGTIGFASLEEDFSLLRAMAQEAQSGGAQGHFSLATNTAALTATLTQLVTSLTNTETRITQLGHAGPARTQRFLKQENYQETFEPEGWDTYIVAVRRCILENGKWKYIGLNNPKACGVIVRKLPFARGAERIVYELREVEREGKKNVACLPGRFAAKENLYVEDETLKMDFHRVFFETQMKAQEFAVKFNQKLAAVLSRNRIPLETVPIVEFLQCHVYTFNDGYKECGLLVENMLDHKKYKKWNSNNGFVDGGAKEFSLEALLDSAKRMLAPTSKPATNLQGPLRIEDKGWILQAFSHFTYQESQRKLLVVDLQGVLDESVTPPVFRLTDPAIHYASNKGRQKVYGRSDHGKRGMHRFWESHQANPICKLLGLPGCSEHK